MVRVKQRFLLCRLEWQHADASRGSGEAARARRTGDRSSISGGEVFVAVRDAVQASFGDFGAARVLQCLQVKDWDAEHWTFALRVPRDAAVMVRAALMFVSSVRGLPVVVHVTGSRSLQASATKSAEGVV